MVSRIRSLCLRLVGRKQSSGDPYAKFRKRLTKVIGHENAEIVEALVDEVNCYIDGVNGDRFRIRFKDRFEQIHRLTGRFIQQDFEPKRTYRPTLLALATTRAAVEQLATIDTIIQYLAAEYEKEQHRQTTIAEISESTAIPVDQLYNVFGYIRDLGIGGGKSSGIPNSPDWYFIPGETLLRLPNLDAVLEQHTKWVEDEARAVRHSTIVADGHTDWDSRWRARFSNWSKRNKYISFIKVGGGLLIAGLLYVLGTLDAVSRVIGSLFGGK